MSMLKVFKQEYGVGFVLSLALHMGIGAFLVFSIQQGMSVDTLAPKKGDIVQAVIIDENRVTAEVERLQTDQKNQKMQAAADLAKAEVPDEHIPDRTAVRFLFNLT